MRAGPVDTTSTTIQILAFPRRATPTNGLDLSAHRSKKEDHSLYVCAIVMVPFLSRMPLQLYDLPCGMLEMLGKSYDDLAQRDATATLQATLKRDGSSFVVDLLTRCEDPRHTSRTNTPGEAPVLCYQYCHNHPRNVKCWATRTEYFDRIMAKHGRKKM